MIRAIRTTAQPLRTVTDQELKRRSLALKYAAMTNQTPRALVVQAFPLVLEAERRHLGLELYDVQLMGGIRMAGGGIAEMKTGEGKTITAALPTFLYGLSGRGCHVVTVNDYLAERDMTLLRPVYESLGLTVGVILADHDAHQRAEAYRCDITYGTAKEFGFDFLRDRLKRSYAPTARLTMRELHAVLVDEADSVLIDEARTPLIIGVVDPAAATAAAECHRWAAEDASEFVEAVDYNVDPQRHTIALTVSGLQRLGQLPQNESTRGASTLELKDYVEKAIHAHRNLQKDKHYAVREEGLIIIDEYTGRPADGRQWQAGIHQAVEAKEGLDVSPRNDAAASVTMQHFFRLYKHLFGMTGTAYSSRRELSKVYRKRVWRVPTNRPVRRTALPTRVFTTTDAKLRAIVEEVRCMTSTGRAVLIGTRSVETSERIAQQLDSSRILHQVLNARHLSAEADIVAQAGQPQAVTVATNMAGRGTDILLHEEVRNSGGLHVMLTELHESARIDQQLIGRCGRQGDPGSYRIFLSLEDEILRVGLSEKAAQRLRQRFTTPHNSNQELAPQLLNRFFAAQRAAERKHFVDRMVLLRQEKDQMDRMFETGQDIYLDTLR